MNNPYVKTLEPVWLHTKDVRVNEYNLQKLIEDMRRKNKEGKLKIPAWDVPNVQPPMNCALAEWLDFICWTSAINFAFTNFSPSYEKFSIEYPAGSLQKGAFAMGASLMRAQEEGLPIFDAWHLSEISLEEIEYVFRSLGYGYRMPMLAERWGILQEVAKVLIREYDGSWFNLFEQADWRVFNFGRGIVEQLVDNFPSFADVRQYNSRRLEFHKRAQLLVIMYHGRAVHSGGRFPLIDDIEDIGPICDYELPKALEFSDVGVLEYSQRMKFLIVNRHVFKPGEPMEVENRLATAYVMKRICDEAGINMAQADYYIWEMGRKSRAPHILVPTTDY